MKMCAYMGNDSGDCMPTKQAAKLVYQFQQNFAVDDAPMRSKAELDRLAELDHQQYLRILDRAADNLSRASQPNPSEGLIDLYAERVRKKKTIEVDADCAKDGDFKSLNLYSERMNK